MMGLQNQPDAGIISIQFGTGTLGTYPWSDWKPKAPPPHHHSSANTRAPPMCARSGKSHKAPTELPTPKTHAHATDGVLPPITMASAVTPGTFPRKRLPSAHAAYRALSSGSVSLGHRRVGLKVLPIASVTLGDGHGPGERAPTADEYAGAYRHLAWRTHR